MNPLKKIKDIEDAIKGKEAEIADLKRTMAAGEEEIADWDQQIKSLRNAAKKPVPSHGVSHGIDVAWGDPQLSALKRAGVTFLCRYYSSDASKNLTRDDAEEYTHAGLDIISVWENQAEAALNGYDQGVSDAKAALKLADEIGQPHASPIYFATDFELTADEGMNVKGYYKGVGDVLGLSRVGVYGGYETVALMHASNLARYLWQTLAWSGGKWYPAAQIRQTRINVNVAGSECDLDLAVTADFGQWRL